MQIQSSLSQQLITLRDYIRWACSRFSRAGLYFGHGNDNALDEAMELVLASLDIPIGAESTLLDARLTLGERLQLLALIERRVSERIPLPYLLGEARFAGLKFSVDQRVLIPRSPIAELIEQGFEPWLQQQPVTSILDLCCGSGCIGIASAHYFAEATVDLADLSADALLVARKNIDRYDLAQQVFTVESDLFSALHGRRYQLIVSNPPYVDKNDLASMPAEYHYEPSMALGSGDDGLDICRRILAQASQFLTEDGILVVEVGNSCVALEQAYPQVPFTWVELERGGHGVFVFSRSELLQFQSLFV